MMVLDSVRCYTIGSNFSVSTFTSHSSFRSSFSKKSSSIVRPRAVEPDLFFVSRTDHVVSRAATHAASLEIIARRAYCVGTMYKSMCVCSFVRPFVRSVFGHVLDRENASVKGIWPRNLIQNWSKSDQMCPHLINLRIIGVW